MAEAAVQRSPIVSLTVVDGRTVVDGAIVPASRVLVVARSPEANPTHPDVVSVPTLRIPPALYDDIVASATPVGTDETGHATYFGDGEADSASHNGHAAVVHATEALLARKLGLAETLESEELRYRAALRSRVDGVAVYDNLGDANVYEPVSMLNILVEVTDAHEAIPISTSSYKLIGWTSVDQFLRGVRTRDVTAMGPLFDPIDLCAHGVCLAAAQETLVHVLGRRAFAPPSMDEHGSDLSLRPASLPGAVAGVRHRG
jgi:hypothetical protein